MNPSARSALTLAVLLVLPQLQALCPRLAPDVISGKVIPCRYLCIKINFLELPSIILSTERDGVLCSTLLLRRRGVCKNGGCIPFGSDDDIKPKGALGKVIAAIDKFASGSYRQKPPKPGTPFGPIVSTATSLFGGGSSTTSGGTSSAASSIVATATAAAVGSSLKKLFSESSSPSSENKRRNERPTTNPFGPSLSSILKPEHPANAAGGILASGSSAVPVSFGGGPPVLPPSTEGGAEHENTHASPGTALTNPGGPAAHPALTHFNNPLPPKQKDSLSPGSPSDVSHSAGGAITKAIGLVLGNLQKMSGTPTSGIPSGQQTSGGPVVSSQHHLDSTVRNFPKTTGVAENIHIRGATGESSIPTAFPVGPIPPIAHPSRSSRTESDGKERFGGLATSVNQEGRPLITPGAPAVTSLEYKSKLPPTASSPSQLPSVVSQASGAASRAGNSAGPYREALARLREISQGSARNTLPGQPLPAAFGETSVPSSRSSVITPHKSTSDHGVTNYKETAANVPSARATPIPAGLSHGRPAILPSTGVVADRHPEETSRWPQAPNKKVSLSLNTAKEAAEVPAGSSLGPSLLRTTNPIGRTSPSVRISLLKPPPTPPSESSSGRAIKISHEIPLKPLKQAPAGTPAISVRQPSAAVRGENSAPTNNSPMAILRKRVNEPEVQPTKNIAIGHLHDNPTQAAAKSNGGPLPNPPSTLAPAGKNGTEAFQESNVSSMIPRPSVIVTKTIGPNITTPGGISEMSTNKPSEKPSPSIRNSPRDVSSAVASTSANLKGVKRTFGGVLHPLKRLSGSTEATIPFRKPPSALTGNPSNPRTGSRILHKAATGSEVKPPEETLLGALDGSRTNAAVKFGGGAPSVAPSTVAQTERGGAEASRLSAATSKISQPAVTAVTHADASINNIGGPTKISTKHGNEPSPSIRSTGLEETAASKSTTAVRRRKKKTFRGILKAFRRARIRTTSRSRSKSRVATNAKSKPSGSSSIQSSHKGASHAEVNESKTTVSGVLPGNPTPRNVQIGSGASSPSRPAVNAAGINPTRTSPSSAAEKSALQPSKGVREASQAGTTNIEHNAQAINGPVSSNKNAALEFVTASRPSSPSGSRMEKGLAGTSSTLPRISENSATLNPSKKSSLVAPSEKLKPIIDMNKRMSRPQKGHIKAEIKGTLLGSAAMIPSAVGNNPSIFPSSTEKSPKTGSMGVAQRPPVPLLRPMSAVAGMTETRISRTEAHPQLTSSIPDNGPLPSIKTAPVQPGTSSLNLNSPERLQRNRPTPSTAPSPKEQSQESHAGKPKQSQDSQARSPHSAATAKANKTLLNISRSIVARPDVAYGSRASVRGGGEPAGKTSTVLTLAPSKKPVSGEVEGTKNAMPPRPSIESVVTAGIGSLPESKKAKAGKPSISTSDSSNLPPVTIVSAVLRHSRLNQRKHPSGSQATRNEGMKESVASSSRDLGSTKPNTGMFLSSGVKGSMLSGLSAVVQHSAPNVLLTRSHSRDSSSLSIGSKSQEKKSHDVETKTANKTIASVLDKLKGNLSSKPKEDRTSTYYGKRLAENNVARIKSSFHGGVEAKVIDGRNGLSKKEDHLHISNNMTPISNLGSLSSPIASGPSKAQIAQIKSSVQTATAQRNKPGHRQGKKILTMVPSGTGTANRSPDSRKEYESVNKANSNSASTTTSNSEEAPRNTASPNSPVPATHVSASSAAATGTKNAALGISPISHVNTVASPSKTTAASGLALSAHAGDRLMSRITAESNQPPPVAAAPISRNGLNGSKQGSETNSEMNARANSEGTRESRTSSQNTLSSSGRFESIMSPRTDTSSRASSVSTLKSTPNLPLEKHSSGSTAHPASIPTLVSAALRPASPSSVPNVHAANGPADTLKIIGTSEKPIPTVGPLPNPKGSVFIGPAAESVETPRPKPGTPTKTTGDAYNSRTSGPQAGLTTGATSRVPAPHLETRGATSGSTANVPSATTASKTDSRNTSPQASRNEVIKAENATTRGSRSDLPAGQPISSAPHNVQTPRLQAATTANNSVKSARASTPRLRPEAGILEGNARTNVKVTRVSAGSSEKSETNSTGITVPTLSLPGEKIVSSSLITLKKALKPPAKPTGIIRRLGSLLSVPKDALKLKVLSGESAVPNLKSEAAGNNGKSAVTETKPKTVSHDLTQPEASEKQPSQPTPSASVDIQRTPTFNTEEQAPTLYARMRSPGGIVFGRHPTMSGGFWGPPQGMPGMFRPF